MHKIGQSAGFLGRSLGPLLKTGLLLIGDVLKLLSKSVLMPFGLTAASATDAAIHKKAFWFWLCSGFTSLIISIGEMNDIMKIVKSLEASGLLIKGVSQTIKNGAKKQKGGFLNMFLGTLGAGLLGNLSTGKDTISAGEGTIRAGQDF